MDTELRQNSPVKKQTNWKAIFLALLIGVIGSLIATHIHDLYSSENEIINYKGTDFVVPRDNSKLLVDAIEKVNQGENKKAIIELDGYLTYSNGKSLAKFGITLSKSIKAESYLNNGELEKALEESLSATKEIETIAGLIILSDIYYQLWLKHKKKEYFEKYHNTIRKILKKSGYLTLNELDKVKFISIDQDESIKKKNLFVISIGANNYNNSNIKNLMYPEKDALDIATTFKSIIDSYDVQIETFIGFQATKENIYNSLDALKEKVGEDDVVIFYYSGHGENYGKELTERKLLLPQFEFQNNNKEASIDLGEIKQYLNLLPTNEKFVFIDACQNYIRDIDNRLIGLKNNIEDIDNKNKSIVIISSSSPGEKSIETSKYKNGLFTHSLIKAISDSKKTDNNSDNELSVFELVNYIQSGIKNKYKYQQNIYVEIE